jgi:hypothetical protein
MASWCYWLDSAYFGGMCVLGVLLLRLAARNKRRSERQSMKYEPIRDQLARLVIERDISVSELSRLSGVHRVPISAYFNKRKDITTETADRLFKALVKKSDGKG